MKSFSYDPYLTVYFARYSFDYDFTVKVLESEYLADVVIKDNQDNQDNQDYSVCKSSAGLTIKISEYSYDPDITIKISKYSYDPDFTIKISNSAFEDYDFAIYNDSKILSIEEAISILVIPIYSFVDID